MVNKKGRYIKSCYSGFKMNGVKYRFLIKQKKDSAEV